MAGKISIQPEDVLGGLTGVISVNVVEPKFSSQAKIRLGDKTVGDAIYSALMREFNKIIQNMSDEDKEIVRQHIVNNAKVRQATEIARESKRKSVKVRSSFDLPSKLMDCANAGKSDLCELYICEGDSAAGTIITARDGAYQAVLPVRGKVLNVMKLDFANKKHRERLNKNAEIDSMIKAIGAGVGEHFNIDNCRYGKVIIATDEDVDGGAIACYLLGIFYTLFRPMVEAGMLYKSVTPFYELKYRDHGTDKSLYAMDESERVALEKTMRDKGIKYTLARAKGLGELNSNVFHDIVLNPENRCLKQITMDDAKKAADILRLSIGDSTPDERKRWMIDNNDVIESLGLYQ